MYSNWASRSGWLAPSSAFRLTCREKPILVSSLRTLLGLIEWPMSASADASLSWLFETRTSGRIGSPNVAGSTRRLRSSSNVASRSSFRRGPPPSRRTRPRAGGGASRSFRPRSMVLRANPVMIETAARPPRPAARASLAANNRRPRSSRFEPSASQRRRIASLSIMPTLVATSRATRDHPSRVTPSHLRDKPIHLLLRLSLRCVWLPRRRIARHQAVDHAGTFGPVEGAVGVAAGDERCAGVEHFILDVARSEFRSERIPGELEEFHPLLRREDGRFLRLGNQAGKQRIVEVRNVRWQHDETTAGKFPDRRDEFRI